MFRQITRLYLGVIMAAALLPATVATAAVKNWIGGHGPWSLAHNWSGGTVPANNDAVNLVFNDGGARTITYDVSAPSLGLLSIDMTGFGETATFSMPGNNNLTATGIVVGGYSGTTLTNGRGALNQSGGTTTTSASRDLILGFGAGSTGDYTLSGGALVINFNEYVGFSGTGTFNHTGGSHTVNASAGGSLFSVGHNAGSTGTYNLSGTGTLSTATSQVIGYAGIGTFNQSGGTNTINPGHALLVGYDPGSIGNYTISNTGVVSIISGNQYIGRAGAGTLSILSGGTVSSDYAEIGTTAGALGTVNVNGPGSTWSMRVSLDVGVDGIGYLNITNGGQVSVVNNRVTLGYHAGSGAVLVDGVGSTLDVGEELVIGGFQGAGSGSLTIRNGGHVTNGLGYIGYSGGTTGTVTVDGAGSTWTNTDRLFVGTNGYGSLAITNGGKVTSTEDAFIGYGNDEASGVVEVTGAGSNWTVSDVDPAGLYVGFNGTGVLAVNAGGVVTADVGNGVQVGTHGTLRGDSTIAGRVSNHGAVAPGAWPAGAGLVPGTLTITGQYFQSAGGVLQIDLASAGSYDKLDVLGGNLDGTLNVTLLNGYVPAAGASFNILDKSAAGTLNGAFATVNLPLLPLALDWDTSQLYTTGVLSVTGTGLLPLNVALFNVVAPSAGGPPYPAPSIAAEVRARLIPGEPTVPVERLRLSLADAAIPTEPMTPVPMN
jgi:T5SS/PEP-CTERM-associated repeat protein